jgi:hypothetical protein
MPIISTFHGIVIQMFYEEHEPPHFHAEHHGDHATLSFGGDLLAGTIRSHRARRMLRQWAALHVSELDTNWQRLKAGRPLERIEPLD